jgi:hypothetical protein
MLKRIFESKRKEVTRGWRKVHHDEFKNLHSSSNMIKKVKMSLCLTKHAMKSYWVVDV